MSSILDALKKLELERDKKTGQSPPQSYSPSSSRDLLSGPDRRGPRTITLTPAKLAIGAVTIGACMVVLSVAVSLIIANGAKSGVATPGPQANPAPTQVASAVPPQKNSRIQRPASTDPRPVTHVTTPPSAPAPATPALQKPATNQQPPVTAKPPQAAAQAEAQAPAPAPKPIATVAPPVAAPETKELVVTEQAIAAPPPPTESSPRPIQKPEPPAKTAQAPVPVPVEKETPKKTPPPPKPVEPARIEVAKVTEETKEPEVPAPVEKAKVAPKPRVESRLDDPPKIPAKPKDSEETENVPLDGEGAKSLSEEVNLSALPTLSESERLRLDLPKLKINIVGLPTKRQPHPSALINLNKVYVGENIPNTDARLIAVELRGVGIEVNGRKYFLPK